MNRNEATLRKQVYIVFEKRQQFTVSEMELLNWCQPLVTFFSIFLHPGASTVRYNLVDGHNDSIFAFAPKVFHAPKTLLEKNNKHKLKKPRKKPQQQQKDKYN